jgi:hypothetical protein
VRECILHGGFFKLINVTANVGEVAPFRFHADGTNDGSAAISVWNTLGWRKVAIPEADAKEGTGYNFSLGKPKNNDAPGLMTAVKDGKLFWGLSRIGVDGVLEFECFDDRAPQI